MTGVGSRRLASFITNRGVADAAAGISAFAPDASADAMTVRRVSAAALTGIHPLQVAIVFGDNRSVSTNQVSSADYCSATDNLHQVRLISRGRFNPRSRRLPRSGLPISL